MNTEWVQESSGRTGIVVTELDLGDGVPPLMEFWMDISPREIRSDRLGVASALIFGRYAAGRFTPPQAISSGVGQAIAAHSNGRIIPTSIRSGVDAIPEQGGVQIVLEPESGGMLELQNSVVALRRVGLGILQSDMYSGRLISMDRLLVASNAWLHGVDRAESWTEGLGIRAVNVRLAVAVLIASDLQASSVLSELPEETGVYERRTLERLLSAVGLGLGWYSAEGNEIKVHG